LILLIELEIGFKGAGGLELPTDAQSMEKSSKKIVATKIWKESLGC
jgi:hypothetical protein